MSMSCHPHYKSGSSLFCRLTSRRVEDCQDCDPVAHKNSHNVDPDAVRRRTDLARIILRRVSVDQSDSSEERWKRLL
jgi:hypothetical protein